MNYFYKAKAKTPAYMAVPLFLLKDEPYRGLSSDAKLLYGALLRRVDLSRKSGWTDGQGRIYLFYPISEVQEFLGCCKQKAVDTLAELEQAGLLDKISQGQGKPSKIFLKTKQAGYESDSCRTDYEDILRRNSVF